MPPQINGQDISSIKSREAINMSMRVKLDNISAELDAAKSKIISLEQQNKQITKIYFYTIY